MEFYQLEHFLAVAEEGGFTRAAERVFRSQAAVSVAIRKLEEELGLPLVLRDNHECELTEAGHVLLEQARQLIAMRNEMQRIAAEFTSSSKGRVRIAAHESAAQYLLPAPLATFHRLFPDVRIETRLCNVDEIAVYVAERRVDFGFGIRQSTRKGLCSEGLFTDPLVLIGAADSPLLRKSSLHVTDLATQRFYVHHLHTVTTNQIQDAFDRSRTPFDVVGELWNFETVKQFVAAGSGVAIVPLSVVRADLDAGRLATAPVEGLAIQRSIDLVYREGGRLMPSVSELLALLRKWRWADGRALGTTSAPPRLLSQAAPRSTRSRS